MQLQPEKSNSYNTAGGTKKQNSVRLHFLKLPIIQQDRFLK